jgi:hypothetical protein
VDAPKEKKRKKEKRKRKEIAEIALLEAAIKK